MRLANLLALGMVLVGGTAIHANGNSIFGVDPSKIQYKVIDTSNAIAPVPMQTRPLHSSFNDARKCCSNFNFPSVSRS